MTLPSGLQIFCIASARAPSICTSMSITGPTPSCPRRVKVASAPSSRVPMPMYSIVHSRIVRRWRTRVPSIDIIHVLLMIVRHTLTHIHLSFCSSPRGGHPLSSNAHRSLTAMLIISYHYSKEASLHVSRGRSLLGRFPPHNHSRTGGIFERGFFFYTSL